LANRAKKELPDKKRRNPKNALEPRRKTTFDVSEQEKKKTKIRNADRGTSFS